MLGDGVDCDPDEELVLTLQSSKTTSLEVTQQLVVSEQTEKKIDAAREGYRPSAYRASILYFLLADLARVDPMYQFSLDAYVALFNISLDKSARSDDLQERIKNLNEYHTYFVYRSTCRALFEMHKLLFSFQITAKIMLGAKKMELKAIVEGNTEEATSGANSTWENSTCTFVDAQGEDEYAQLLINPHLTSLHHSEVLGP